MKVVIGTSAPVDKGSGISSYVKEISVELSKRGADVLIVSPLSKDDSWFITNNIKNAGFNVDGRVIDNFSSLVTIIKKFSPDFIVNNDNSLLQSFAPISTCPFVSVCHCIETSIFSASFFNSEFVDYIISISYDMKEKLSKVTNLPAFRIPIIYNGVSNMGSYKTEGIKKDNDKLRVVFSGGSNPKKGADLLLKSILIQPRAWSEFDLHWFGNLSSDMQILKKFPFIQFHGKVSREKFLNELSDSDVFLFPSRMEGCPMALLEAMGLGVVSIIGDSSVGAMKWIVTNGSTGFSIRSKNFSKECIDVLRYLDDNRSIIHSIGKSAADSVKFNFGVGRTVDEIVALSKNPVIQRDFSPKHLKVLRWHRLPGNHQGASFKDKFYFKFGMLSHELCENNY